MVACLARDGSSTNVILPRTLPLIPSAVASIGPLNTVSVPDVPTEVRT